jgi:hypothetical protein
LYSEEIHLFSKYLHIPSLVFIISFPLIFTYLRYKSIGVGFEILIAVVMKVANFWDVVPCTVQSETVVHIQITWHYIPGYRNFQLYCYFIIHWPYWKHFRLTLSIFVTSIFYLISHI